MATIVYLPNPFEPDQREIKEIESTQSGYSLIKEMDFDLDLYDIVIVKNSEVMEADFEIQGDDIVVFSLVPQGGGGSGKDIIKSVALIAVSVAAAYVTGGGSILGTSLGAYTAGSIAAGVAIGVGGGLLINSLMPPQMPKFDSNFGLDSYSSSPTYSFTPLGNIYRDGFTIPVLYGTRRVQPPIISRYLESVDNKQYLHLLLAVAEGGIDDITDIRINDNPISYYENVTTETRLGTNTQTVITDFGDIRSTKNISQVMHKDEYRITQTDGNQVTSLNVLIVATNGLWYVNDNGKIESNSVTFSLEYSADGVSWTRFPTAYTTEQEQTGWLGSNSVTYSMTITTVSIGDKKYYRLPNRTLVRLTPIYSDVVDNYATITGKEQKQLIFSYSVSGLPKGQYQVRAKRLSNEQTSSRYGDAITLWVMDEITDIEVAYRNTALLAVRALASEQLNGDPVITCLATKNLTNPADILLDMITNTRYGAGKDISRTITAQFDTLRDYCNDNGLECNVYFDTQISLQKAIELISSVGYSVLARRGSKFGVMIDKVDNFTTSAVMLTHGSILRDSFKLDYIPLKDRANVIELTYYDETLDYAPQTIEVTQGLYDSNNEIIKTSMQLLATTDRSKAINEARRRLNYNRYLTKLATFDAFTKTITYNVNQVIKVCHTRLLPDSTSGRIVEATLSTVTLDVPVALEVGKSYAIEIEDYDDDSIHYEAMVTGADVTGTILIINPSFSTIPPKYSEYAFGEVDFTTQLMKVLSIGYEQDGRRPITALEYYPAVYTNDTSTIIYPDVSNPYVRGLIVSDYIQYGTDGTIQTVVNLSWQGTLISYGVWYKKTTDTKWTFYDRFSNNYAKLYGLNDGVTYDFVVAGSFTDENKVTYKVIGKTLPPPDITNLTSQELANEWKLSWNYDYKPIDFDHFEIIENNVIIGNTTALEYVTPITSSGSRNYTVRAVDTSGFKSSNVSLNLTPDYLDDISNVTGVYTTDGQKLQWTPIVDDYKSPIVYEIRKGTSWDFSQLIQTTTDNRFLAVANGTYLIKALYTTSSGVNIYSQNPAMIIIDEANLVKNVIAQYSEYSTGWTGTKTNCEVYNGYISLSGVGLDDITDFDYISNFDFMGKIQNSGSYEIPAGHIVTLSSVQVAKLSVDYELDAENINDLFDNIADFNAVKNLDGTTAGDYKLIVQISISQDGITWSDWTDFVAGDYIGKAFKFRVNLYSLNPNVRPFLKDFSFVVDMDDRLEQGVSTTLSTGVKSIIFTKPFQATPITQITIANATAGDDVVLTNETISGFDVSVYNAGSRVVRNINYTSQGY